MTGSPASDRSSQRLARALGLLAQQLLTQAPDCRTPILKCSSTVTTQWRSCGSTAFRRARSKRSSASVSGQRTIASAGAPSVPQAWSLLGGVAIDHAASMPACVLAACTLTSLSTLHRSPSPSPVALRAESQLTGPKERCAKACPSTISLSTTPEAPATPRDTLQCTTATRARERGAATICPAWPWMLLRTESTQGRSSHRRQWGPSRAL